MYQKKMFNCIFLFSLKKKKRKKALFVLRFGVSTLLFTVVQDIIRKLEKKMICFTATATKGNLIIVKQTI